MNEPVQEEKIIGIPKAKYLKITYILLLISAVFGVLTGLFGLIGVAVPLSTLASFLGLGGVVLALLGLFVFNDQFQPQEATHFKYMGFLFLGFLVLGMIVGSGSGALFALVSLALSLAALATMYAGYRIYERGEEATKDNVIKEIEGFKSGLGKS